MMCVVFKKNLGKTQINFFFSLFQGHIPHFTDRYGGDPRIPTFLHIFTAIPKSRTIYIPFWVIKYSESPGSRVINFVMYCNTCVCHR